MFIPYLLISCDCGHSCSGADWGKVRLPNQHHNHHIQMYVNTVWELKVCHRTPLRTLRDHLLPAFQSPILNNVFHVCEISKTVFPNYSVPYISHLFLEIILAVLSLFNKCESWDHLFEHKLDALYKYRIETWNMTQGNRSKPIAHCFGNTPL